jgi:hypothetical protein
VDGVEVDMDRNDHRHKFFFLSDLLCTFCIYFKNDHFQPNEKSLIHRMFLTCDERIFELDEFDNSLRIWGVWIWFYICGFRADVEAFDEGFQFQYKRN